MPRAHIAAPKLAMLLAALAVLVSGCGPTSGMVEEAESGEVDTSSRWSCSEKLSAFDELSVACVNTADYQEGATVVMTFTIFCTIDPGESEGFAVSRFRGRDFGGNLVGWLSRAEASVDGGPKKDLLLRPTSEAFLLDHDQYGIDPLAPGNTIETVHTTVLPKQESLLIRAAVEPERVTTTSLFTWGDWNDPVSYLSERGCSWR